MKTKSKQNLIMIGLLAAAGIATVVLVSKSNKKNLKGISKKDYNKAFKVFDGKQYTLYKSGSKGEVNDYIKKYGIPKNASHKIVNVAKQTRLYLYFNKN